MTYRGDIDGLRAVAVIGVIFYHLKILGFTGGYIGVDVFFVISGYLITGYIKQQLADNTFTLRAFYLRRLRRLGPALLLMSTPVAAAAWVLLYPEDLRSFAASLALQFSATQNFFFLADGEYFRGSENKPLLHTWSLAVEEQYYLFWPLLLVATQRVRPSRQLVLIAALLLGSFTLNLGLFSVSPKASFFLLPPRAWELALGAVVALLEHRGLFAGWLTPRWRTGFGLVGLGSILTGMCTFTISTSFPGNAALLPVGGAALIIISGVGGASVVSRALDNPLLVHIGLISYPLYLWHWPLIAFVHYTHREPSTPLLSCAIVASAVGLAELTYWFIETPIRTRRWLSSTRALVTTGSLVVVVLVAFGVHTYGTEGASYRFPPLARALLTAPFRVHGQRCGFLFRVMHPGRQVCALYAPDGAARRVLLWGNSHADMWSGLVVDLATAHNAAVFLNARNCRATPHADFCGEKVQATILKFIAAEKVTDVVLAASWYGEYEISDDVLERDLTAVVGKLAALGVRIWLVTDIPMGETLDPIVSYERTPGDPKLGSVPLSRFSQQKTKEEVFFYRLAAVYPGVNVIDSSAGLCFDNACWAGVGDNVWYRNAGHLTDLGARTAADQFQRVFSPEPH